MPSSGTWYEFGRSERSIFTEIYFPKRAAYQGAIFNALRFGHDQRHVQTYLRDNVEALLKEFQNYPALFDPHHYSTTTPRETFPTVEEAKQRINMYKSPFKGWSVYTVDGVFFGRRGKMYEEATQVVRIMLRFKSSFTKQAAKAHCEDVLRAILFWTISQQGRLNNHKRWGEAEQAQFMARHKPWLSQKRAFAEQYFTRIAQEITKWIDDRALFVFAYLVRQFWEQVLEEKLFEAEIWVTDLFDTILNVIERVHEKPQLLPKGEYNASAKSGAAITRSGCALRRKEKKLAEEDPEACLVSLLTSINEDLPIISSTLRMTVQRGLFNESVEEARQQLG